MGAGDRGERATEGGGTDRVGAGDREGGKQTEWERVTEMRVKDQVGAGEREGGTDRVEVGDRERGNRPCGRQRMREKQTK